MMIAPRTNLNNLKVHHIFNGCSLLNSMGFEPLTLPFSVHLSLLFLEKRKERHNVTILVNLD